MSGPARIKAKAGAQQADWLSLVEPRGQWLTLPVLRQAFPSGLSPLPVETRREVRERALALDPLDPSSTTEWIEWLLRVLLGWGDRLRSGPQVPDQLTFTVPEHGVRLRPEYVLLDAKGSARVLVERYAPGTALEGRIPGERWAASPIDRAMMLCRALAVPLALVTNGQHFALVYAPIDKTGGHATWDTSLFAEGAEATVLNAFFELLGAQSFFARAADSQLEALMARSAEAQAELTTSLGLQVRRAVELMVASISRANLEAGGDAIRGISPHRVYEAASTVVMRLVFLLYAEERHLLPLGEQVYDNNYAICTLREQLQAESDVAGDEPLELRSDAWQRILATSRAVYAGVSHDRLRMPAYHGSLFDPDRFPFLEGRTDDQPWTTHPARPIRVDDLTIREILTALQIITTTQGGATEARRLSFRALDVEQIGHVYEGLLDHSALRADTVVLGLVGKAGAEPEVTLDDLEAAAAQGENTLAAFLVEQTGRTAREVAKLLAAKIDDRQRRGLLTACDNDTALVARLEPYASLIRDDLRGLPTVFTPGTIYVTETSHRRDTGTEYTTRELADEIVKYSLEPLVYSPGPQDGAEPEAWKLKSPEEILALTVCDPAVGSGAILVAACRYLADRLLEARLARNEVPDGYIYDPSVPAEQDELLVQARRDVADRCLFGVDRDPMAVEMAKLSLWLTTLSKERPFTFVDHAIQSGDSLLGITSLDQLYAFHLDPGRGRQLNENLLVDLSAAIKPMVDAALDARRQLEALPATTVRDLERKAELNRQATEGLHEAIIIADLIVGAALASEGKGARFEQMLQAAQGAVAAALNARGVERADLFEALREQGQSTLNQGRPDAAPLRRPLHWSLAFPEVYSNGGFRAVVGNPPFLGRKYWSARLGREYLGYSEAIVGRSTANADLAAVFIARAVSLLGDEGCLGLLGTSSVAEGNSRLVGYGVAVERGAEIYRARPRSPWPGSASVFFVIAWLQLGPWRGARRIGEDSVAQIGLDLTAGAPGLDAQPLPLSESLRYFIGSNNVRGQSLEVAPGSEWFLKLQAARSPYLRAYYSYYDVASRNPAAPTRFIVDCGSDSLESVRANSEVTAEFLSEVVHPIRTPEHLQNYKGLSDRWWQLWSHNAGSYARLRESATCLVQGVVSKHIAPILMPTAATFTNKLAVIETDRPEVIGLVSSECFATWVRKFSKTRGDETVELNLGAAFHTFPLPSMPAPDLVDLGIAWQKSLTERFRDLDCGVTFVMNALADEGSELPGVDSLRALKASIDFAVCSAFGWSDLDLQHGFHATPQGVRWTFSESVQREVIDRLLELNHARYDEEVASGAAIQKKKAAARGKKKSADDDAQMTLEM